MQKAKLGERWGWLIILWGVASIYLTNQGRTIYGGDAGDLASAVATLGIPHPPGYPLYTLLGILLHQILPWGTLAWRLGFLSTIAAVLSLLLLYHLLFFLTKRVIPSLVAFLVAAFVYPLWLYAEVVEVFALNNFLTVTLLWLSVHFRKNGKVWYFYLASFVFGLALSHHQIILFLLPTLIFLFFQKKEIFNRKKMIISFLFFLTGLSPYLYLLAAASLNPAVNWMGEVTLFNFLALVTRAGYGTFMAGSFIAHEPLLRLLNIWAFFDFFFKDFRVLGIILFLLGVVYLFLKEKKLFLALFLGVVSYLFFLFYASFPLTDNFLVGTFERFIQPLYLLTIFFIAFGLTEVEDFLEKIVSSKKIVSLFMSLFFIYPLGLFTLNYPKVSILKEDFTAENLGRDILNSLPPQSILIVSTDTPLFNTQYVYYTEKKWPGVKLIHLTKLYTEYYENQLRKYYPELLLPPPDAPPAEKFRLLIAQNYPNFPIFSKLAFKDKDGLWMPWGLVFRYFKNEDLPQDTEILKENEKLWLAYQNPFSGSLLKYQNLMLSDVLRVYALSHQEFGFWAAKHAENKEAEKHLKESKRLFPEDLDSYIILSQVYILEKRCQEAQEEIAQVIKREKEEARSFYLKSINYAICFKDREKASFYQKLYEEKSRGRQLPLKKL